MRRLIFKSTFYIVLILISLELIVRIFHLAKDNPARFVDEHQVEKWVPNQEGHSVTGNRKQNFSKFRINQSGFNSYREFTPSKDKTEIAIVGDSFIQGFHQDYFDSLGKKIENRLDGNVEVYEYGYAGYDFANQLHLIHAYKDQFDLIDHVIIGLKFEDDLTREEYKVAQDRMQLEESLLFKSLKKIKLLVYAQNTGALDPLKRLRSKLFSIGKIRKKDIQKPHPETEAFNQQKMFMDNFKKLVAKYGYDKNRFILLIDKSITPKTFIDYLNKNGYKFIDFSEKLKESIQPTTLIYDMHWNNHGRDLIADEIAKYYKEIL